MIDKIIKDIDFAFIDIKHMDREEHIEELQDIFLENGIACYVGHEIAFRNKYHKN
ncbi:hypothetical protein NYR90_18770 [Clostridioides difficile]|nr:hypothetical protein NYR90_18770 [Clostridioides difficile]